MHTDYSLFSTSRFLVQQSTYRTSKCSSVRTTSPQMTLAKRLLANWHRILCGKVYDFTRRKVFRTSRAMPVSHAKEKCAQLLVYWYLAERGNQIYCPTRPVPHVSILRIDLVFNIKITCSLIYNMIK
jgi:hypothetical protein